MVSKMLGGRYTVQDKIGTGGMATVYRGLDEVLGRTVAIKTMLPQYASDPSFAARFKQEAQAAAALPGGQSIRRHSPQSENASSPISSRDAGNCASLRAVHS